MRLFKTYLFFLDPIRNKKKSEVGCSKTVLLASACLSSFLNERNTNEAWNEKNVKIEKWIDDRRYSDIDDHL